MSVNEPRKSPAAIRELRRKKVAANLLAGLNYREIAHECGVSIGTVAKDVKILLSRWNAEQLQSTEEYVSLEVRRLDRALNAIWLDVLAGDDKAITAMLRVEERRAKLLGMDQPEKVEHSGSVEQRRADPLEGLDVDTRSKLIDNLIVARRLRTDASAG